MRGLVVLVAALIVLGRPTLSYTQTGPGKGIVRGLVLRDSTNAPIADAEVRLAPANVMMRTGADGAFAFRRVAAGEQRMTVRAAGFAEAEAMVTIPADGLDGLEVMLTPRVTTLGAVEVRTTPVPRYLDGFERRRAFGIGRFLDSTVLWTHGDPNRWYDRVVERAPGIRLVGKGSKRSFIASARGVNSWKDGQSSCPVRVLVDGQPTFGADEWFIVEDWDGPPIVAVEYYTPAQLPAEFNRLGSRSCGAIVLWTQR